MAQGTQYQGAWQQQSFQGPWQEQSHQWADTLADTISLSDALALKAGIAIADGITATDSGIQVDASMTILDSILLSDLLSLSGGFVESLSDSITLSDVLTASMDYAATISDSITLSDLLEASASVYVNDSVTLADLLNAAFTKNLSVADTITLSDILSSAFGKKITITDTISLVDVLHHSVSEHIADITSLSDSLTGVLAFGIIIPGQADVTTGVTAPRLQPSSWDKEVTNEPSPVAMYSRSSANTTFTNKTVTDGSVWDLSDAEVGDVAVTEDYFIGVVSQVDAANNRIYVDTWNLSLPDVGGLPVRIPTNSKHVTLHKVIAGKRVLIMSDATNDNIVYIGTNDSVTPDDGLKLSNQPGNRNFSVMFKAPVYYKKINVSSIWAVCGSTQKIHVTVDGMIPKAHGSSGSGMAYKQTLTDSITLADHLTGVLVNTGPPIVQTNDVVVDGNYMYCAVEDATAGGGILIYNISDPAHPARVSYLSLTADINNAPKRIVKSGDYVYTSYRYGIRTINVSNPSSMVLGQELAVSGTAISGVPTVAISGTSLYFQGINMGLRKYNSSNPAALSLADILTHGTIHYDPNAGGFEPYVGCPYYSTPYGGYGVVFQTGSCVYTDGSFVYAATNTHVWKMSLTGNLPVPGDPGNLIAAYTRLPGPSGNCSSIAHAASGGNVVAYCQVPITDAAYGYMQAVYTGGHYTSPLYVPSNDLVANSNIGAILAPANGYAKFRVYGTEGYIVGRPGCVILTLSSGAVLNTISGTYRGHDVDSDYLYIAETDGGGNHHIDIYDISTPASPTLVGTAT